MPFIHTAINVNSKEIVEALVNKGANVQVVAKYLGHTKVEETLKTYSHLFISTLDEVVAVIDNLDNNKTDDN